MNDDGNDGRYADLDPNQRLITFLFHDHTLGDPPDKWCVGVATPGQQPGYVYGSFDDRPEAEIYAQQLRDNLAADPYIDDTVATSLVTVIPVYQPCP